MTTHGPSGRPSAASSSTRIEHPAAAEHHLADQDEVVLAGCAAARKRSEKVSNGRRRCDRPLIQAFLFPPRKLPSRAVELAVGGEHADSAARRGRGGQQPDQEIMGVGAKRRSRPAGRCQARRQPRPEPRARPRPSLCPTCGRRGGRRRSKPQPGLRSWRRATDDGCARRNAAVRDRRRDSAENSGLETQRSVLSAHSSGNTRFSSVARR